MRYIILVTSLFLLLSCNTPEKRPFFSEVDIEVLYKDSLSFRAIELMGGSLGFAANKGVFGTIDLQTKTVRTNIQKYDTLLPEFRSIAHTSTDFFMLSVSDPALLYKTGDKGSMELVYTEVGEGVFYDAMAFWNDKEGIAIGDKTGDCLSIIITRDGGYSWNKLSCTQLPEATEGEGAFAASNTNIAIQGDKAWIGTSKGRILYTADKGLSWDVIQSPMKSDKPTQGIYSLDFEDELLGIAIGGDYTDPNMRSANKMISRDGGISWELIADNKEPGYKSCIRFVPNSDGKEIVAIGFTGISYSSDMGANWKSISDEGFYTIRFQNDSVAYAAGANRIAKLTFK
ncbi:oxidoreductase [uncultured Eudoraea sp.]|uniref:WD40/YVTN/BNR-like repeat-containing protein n=1 Tax=uncultured Eudoraea sp. TaxID=1035614 RepID=UPI0026309CAD|nr:oxidoreductase [uncultured Eudoraea sp.]